MCNNDKIKQLISHIYEPHCDFVYLGGLDLQLHHHSGYIGLLSYPSFININLHVKVGSNMKRTFEVFIFVWSCGTVYVSWMKISSQWRHVQQGKKTSFFICNSMRYLQKSDHLGSYLLIYINLHVKYRSNMICHFM